MTGRGRELADLMERRKVGVLCVQETRWKGNKARELGGDCKLFYSGADERGRNGVGIVLSKEFKDSLVSVSRTNDRVMSVKLGIGETVVNVICAYAPQMGCEDEEKETFWRQMDQELRAIPEGERVPVAWYAQWRRSVRSINAIFIIIIMNSQTSRAARSLNSVVTSRGVPAYCFPSHTIMAHRLEFFDGGYVTRRFMCMFLLDKSC